MQAVQTSRPSTKEVQLQAELAVWKDRAKAAFAQAHTHRRNARTKNKLIEELKNQLAQNRTITDEKATSIDMLPADSLGGYIAEQLNFLDTAWY